MNYKIYMSILASMSLASCGDFLETENKSMGGQNADSYFATAEGVAKYRVYAYSLLEPLGTTSYQALFEKGGDLYWNVRGAKPDAFDTYQIAVDNGDVKSLYTACYKLINCCNGVMSYGGDTYASEMKFLRSYAYYILTQQFGGVPYVTEYIANANTNYPREDLKTIYQNILADLDEVISDSKIPEITHDGTPNKKAAYALAAKVALAAGWDLDVTVTDANTGAYSVNGTSFFTKAEDYAKKATDGITLYDNFSEKWSQKNEGNNQEEFFSVQFDRASFIGTGTDAGHSLQNAYGGYYNDQKLSGDKQSGSSYGPSLKSAYLWEEGDSRYFGTFACTHYNFLNSDKDKGEWGTSGYYQLYNDNRSADLGIRYYFAPWYVGKAGLKEFVEQNKALFNGADYANPICYATMWASPIYQIEVNGEKVTESEIVYSETHGLSNTSNGACDCVTKYDDAQTIFNGGGKSCRDIVLLHASASILDLAEAQMAQGKTSDAIATLNILRNRAGAPALTTVEAYNPPYKSEVGDYLGYQIQSIDLVLDERARETYAERCRWMDIKRTKQMCKYYLTFKAAENNACLSIDNMKNSKGEIRWLRPIPTDEIGANSGMTDADQNPGY